MFQYFIPGSSKKPTVAELRAIGLGHLFDDDGDVKFREVTGAGPGGNTGVVIGRGPLGYYGEKQTWDDWGDFWLGYDSIPTPSDLVRDTQVAGNVVRINGQNWLIPKARHFEIDSHGELVGGCSLPRRYGYDRDSKTWVPTAIKREYERLWDLSLVYIDMIASLEDKSDDKVTIASEQIDEFFECALSTNYRVGKPEIDILGVYDSESTMDVLHTVIDLAGFNSLVDQVVKKKEETRLQPTGGGSNDGQGSSIAEENQLTTQA